MSKKAKTSLSVIFLSFCTFASFTPRSARADEDPALERAKKHFTEGQANYIKNRFSEAATSFLAAYKEKPFAAFLYNVAVSYEKGENYAQAISYFKKYLEEAPKTEAVSAIRKRIQALEKHLAHLGCKGDEDCEKGEVCRDGECVAAPEAPPVEKCAEDDDCGEKHVCADGICVPKADPDPKDCTEDKDCGPKQVCKEGKCTQKPRPAPKQIELPPIQTKGLVLIDSNPQGAQIWLDDKMNPPIGVTPFQGSLPEGKYTVLIEMKGSKPEKRRIEVSSQRILDLYFALSTEHYLGWIEVTSNIPGAEVFIDDLSVGAVGRTPYSGFRKPGRHTIWVKKPGFKTEQRSIDIASGESNTINIQMERVAYGWIDLAGGRAKGAQVRVGGKKTCRAPCRAVKIQAGEHMVTVSKKGHKTLKKTVVVKKGERTRIDVKLVPTPSRVSAYVTYGFAAATLGGAIFAALKAKSIRDDIDRDIKNNVLITNKDDRYREGKIYSIVANGLFGVTAVAAAVGLYYQFRNPGPESSAVFTVGGVSLSPQLGPGTVAVRGRIDF